MKKTLCLCLAIALCLGLCACGSEELTSAICSGEWVCNDHFMDMEFSSTYDRRYISLNFYEDNTCQLRSEQLYEDVFAGYETKTCTWEIKKGKIVVDGTDIYEYVDGKLLGSSSWDDSFTFIQKAEAAPVNHNNGECETMWLVESSPLYRYTYNEYGELIARTSGPESDYEHSYSYEYLFNDDQTLKEVRTFRDDKIHEVLLFDENGNICKSYEFDDFGHLQYTCEYKYENENVQQLFSKRYKRNVGQEQKIDLIEWSEATFGFHDNGAFKMKSYCKDMFDIDIPRYSILYTPEGERDSTLLGDSWQDVLFHHSVYDDNGNVITLYASATKDMTGKYNTYPYTYVEAPVSPLQQQIMEAKERADISDTEKFERDLAREVFAGY